MKSSKKYLTASALILGLGAAGTIGLSVLSPHNDTLTTNWQDEAFFQKAAKHNREDYSKSMEASHYLKYLTSIRTKEGRTHPDYRVGYAQRELQKLLQNKRLARTTRTEEFEFVERGPGNVAGRTRAILVDLRDTSNNTWWIGTAGGGIWQTTDGGSTWVDKSGSLKNLAVTSITQCATSPTTMYLATGESPFGFGSNLINGGGIWKSTDGGESWSLLPETQTEQGTYRNFTRVLVSPQDPDLLIASAVTSNYQPNAEGDLGLRVGTEILRSVDGGQTWTVVARPSSIAVLQLVADPTDFTKLYASVYQNGVLRSTDGGLTWQTTSVSAVASVAYPARTGRTEIAIAPTNPSVLYASVEIDSETSNAVLLMSDDAGENWRIVEQNRAQPNKDYLGGQGWYDNCIVVDPSDANTVYWGGVDLWKTTITTGDVRESQRQFLGGEEINTSSWLAFTRVEGFKYWDGRLDIPDVNRAVSVEIRFGEGKTQKAHRFLARGGNAGAGVPPNEYTYQDYVDVPFEVWDIENNRQLMVSFRDQRNDGQFTLTTRDETDTQLLNTREYIFIHDITYATTPSTNVMVNGGHEVESMYFVWPFLVQGESFDPNREGIVRFKFGKVKYQNSAFTRVSDAYGDSGNNANELHPDHHMLAFAGNTRLISANDGGIAYSDDQGKTWREVDNFINSNLNTSQYYKVDRHPTSNIYVGGMQDNGTWVSTPNPTLGSNYNEVVGGDGMECAWHATNPNLVLASYQFNNFARSTNGGTSFSRVNFPESGDTQAPFVTRIGYSPVNPEVVFAVAASGVYKSTNFGNTWSKRPISDSLWRFSSATVVHASLAVPNVILAGSGMSASRTVFISTDGGDNFRPLPNTLEIGVLSGIKTNPENSEEIYLLFSQAGVGKIWRSQDLGETWTDITGFNGNTTSSKGFPDVAVMDMVVWGDTLLVGTEIGMMASFDSGNSWVFLEEFPPVSVHSLVVKENDGQLVIGTHGRGIWTADLGISYNRDGNNVVGILNPTEAIQVKVYPNPTTNKIRFELPQTTTIYQVAMYSLTGQEVLKTTVRNGGNTELNLQKLTNGTYLLKATDGKKVYTQKVIVSK